MSRRPFDPFSPRGNWTEPMPEMPSDQGPDKLEMITDPPPVPPPAAPPLPERLPEADTTPPPPTRQKPVKATKPRRARTGRRKATPTLEEALARLEADK